MTRTIEINEKVARKVLRLIDHPAGLTTGLGKPEPGKMCIEAVVCFALGQEHGDRPVCVAPALRNLKIKLNDANWPTNQARAKGMRRLGLAQLGSAGVLDEQEFARRCATLAIQTVAPAALRTAAKLQKSKRHADALEEAAKLCETTPTRDSALKAETVAYDAAAVYAAAASASAASAAAHAAFAYDAASASAASAAVYAASAYDAAAAYDAASAARFEILSNFAESVVQILIEMKAPGCKWLFLAEEGA